MRLTQHVGQKRKKKASCLIIFEVDLSRIKGVLVPQELQPIPLNQWAGLPAFLIEIPPSSILLTLSH